MIAESTANMRAGTLTTWAARHPVTTFGRRRIVPNHFFQILFCQSKSPNHHLLEAHYRNLLSCRRAAAYFSSAIANKESGKNETHQTGKTTKNDIKTAIFPRTLPDPDNKRDGIQRIQYPKTFASWKRVFICAWTNYRSTWDGFAVGGSSDDEDKKKKEDEKESEMKAIIEEQRKTISSNVEKNVEFVKEEAPKFFEFVQKETKIYNKEDLKRWAAEQLKLATLCLNEFMAGYRSGRDGEMDKMLNEYFKEEDEEAVEDKVVGRKRRKAKRLVRNG